MHLSVLDLAPITEGSTAAEAFARSRDLAQHVEQLGYHRFWLAEHHNMPGIASAATALAISHVAAGTKTIRVGSGGIMLLNHSPLVIAEQFGTLESLYPGRIDLGLGRAPGTDQATMRILREGISAGGDEFPQKLEELETFLKTTVPGQRIRAVPGAGTHVPIYLLGSGGFSAQLAGVLGLPFASAGHFSPDNLLPGLAMYRKHFKPSAVLQKPHAMVCINVFAADTYAEAERLATSQYQAFLNLVSGNPAQLPPPVDNLALLGAGPDSPTPFIQGSIMGDPTQVELKLKALIADTQADELIIHSMIYDHKARKKSYDIIADIAKRL